jgi:hypothetical protein
MSLQIPTHANGITPAFLSELVGELRPGVTVKSAEIVKIKNYGEADNTGSVSTSVQVLTYAMALARRPRYPIACWLRCPLLGTS